MWRAGGCGRCTRNFLRDPSRGCSNGLQSRMNATLGSRRGSADSRNVAADVRRRISIRNRVPPPRVGGYSLFLAFLNQSWRRRVCATFSALMTVVSVVASRAAENPHPASMQITSTSFLAGEPIPVNHTCDGNNVSPPLQWSGPPAGTKSLALIVDDPDAPMGIWVHWVLFNLPANTTELAEDVPKGQYLPNGARQGLNDFKHLGYGGPCPPPGKPHRYFFKVYALSATLDLKPGATRKDVERAMEKLVLGQGQLMGTYKRR